jgi:hypothetical protein
MTSPHESIRSASGFLFCYREAGIATRIPSLSTFAHIHYPVVSLRMLNQVLKLTKRLINHLQELSDIERFGEVAIRPQCK